MKKIVLTIALAAFAFAANAQFVIGGQIGFSTSGGNGWYSNSIGTTTTEFALPADVHTDFAIAPKFGYNINPQMHVGIVLGFTSNTIKDYSVYDSYYTSPDFEGWVKTTSTGFYIAPYFRYSFLTTNRFTFFAEAQAAYGFIPAVKTHTFRTAIDGVISARDETSTGNTTTSNFSLSIVPGVNYRISNRFSADLYVDLLGLAFTTSTAHYRSTDDGDIRESKRTSNSFRCVANLNAETLEDHLGLFRLGFNYHF